MSKIQKALSDLNNSDENFLRPEGLAIYSPKFLKMLNNITENEGLHLVYSQFRTLEGIGVFSMVLEKNGFARFTIGKDAVNEWTITVKEEDMGKPMFALYTGTENNEEREIIRNIYNGAWDKIPTSLREQVERISENNHHGEIIKVFMITSSGAEGITLKNTRYVHITEPYWHPVRVEQVIGRARRICSHNELPENERNVTVFVYLMRFTEHQKMLHPQGIATQQLLDKDGSKHDKDIPLTSDQALWEISNIKEKINKQILSSIKGSSIDCTLHNDSTDDEPIVCMSFGKTSPEHFVSPPDYNKTVGDATDKMNKQVSKFKGEKIELGGKLYIIKRFDSHLSTKQSQEGELYDYDSYQTAVKTGKGEPMFVGYLRIVKGGVMISDS